MVRTLENGPFTEDSHGSDRDSPCAGLAKPLAGETMKMISQHSKIPWKMAAAEFLADFSKRKKIPWKDSGSRCCMKRQKAKNK